MARLTNKAKPVWSSSDVASMGRLISAAIARDEWKLTPERFAESVLLAMHDELAVLSMAIEGGYAKPEEQTWWLALRAKAGAELVAQLAETRKAERAIAKKRRRQSA